MTAANHSTSAPPTQPASNIPRRCGLATASLVCGILGPCTVGLAAVAGLILGIIALSRIAKSAGQLTGRGLAIAGIILSAATPVLLAIVAMLAGILLPAVFSALDAAKSAHSMNNVQQLCMATHTYATLHRQQLPPADSWPQVLQEQMGLSADVMTDPDDDKDSLDPDDNRAYAMNAGLGGTIQHPDPSRTVLFFECRPGTPPAGGPDLLPDEPRHAGRYVIGFLDGHVERVAPEEVKQLLWQPKREAGF